MTTDTQLPNIELPESINYIAAFLTFSCQLRCSYCINHHGGDLVKGRWMNGEDWIKGLNRIKPRPDLPITIQGGEPTVHKHFYKIAREINPAIPLDLLTNLEVDAAVFHKEVSPTRFKREAPYASIRVSYHHGQSNFQAAMAKVLYLKNLGYSIGIWEVDNPEYHGEVIVRQQQAHSLGIDYRLKEFLGPHKGEVHGTMRYEEAVNSHWLRSCMCRTSELIIAPDGHVFRCHSDLYASRGPIGHMLDPNFGTAQLNQWAPCAVYGACNACDIKIKTDRRQTYGHSSVEIKEVSKPYAKNPNHVSTVVNTYGKTDAKNEASKSSETTN